MGFSRHPGALPFCTIRTAKWVNRVEIGELVQIQGEHGCRMDKTPARVVRIEPHGAPCPPELEHVYRGQELYRIYLDRVDPGDPDLARYMFPV